MQIDFFRKQSDDHKKEAIKWRTMYEELKNSSNHDINQVNKTDGELEDPILFNYYFLTQCTFE